MKKLIFIIFCTGAFGVSPQQYSVAQEIFNVAKRFTEYPTTIVAIAAVESSLGVNNYNPEGSLGPLQIRVETVRWLETIYDLNTSYLTNGEIAVKLLTDTQFSVVVACTYINHYVKYRSWASAVGYYNGGGRHNKRYINKIQKKMKEVNRWGL